MEVYDGEGHNREPDINPVFNNLTSEELYNELAIWDKRNKETVVVSDYYVEL